MGVAKVRPIKRGTGCHLAMRLWVRRGGLGVGRFEAHAAGGFDGPEDDLQRVQRAAGLEAVGMGRDPAHRVKADRAAHHLGMFLAAEIGPFLIDLDGLVESDLRKLRGNGADAVGADAATLFHGLWRIFVRQVAVGHEVKDRAVRDTLVAVRRGEVGFHPLPVPWGKAARAPVDDLRLAVVVAQEEAVLIGFLILIDQNRGIGEARQIVEVDAARFHQAMDERQDEQTVRAGRDPHPFIRHRVIAGADRVHADDLGPTFLDLAQPDLDGVAVVVFGHAEDHHKLGQVPVRLSEFPESTAHGVDAGSGHVDRTKPAVGREIGGAIALRPKPGEALRLVAAGEEGELFGGGLADRFQPADGKLQRLVPGNLLELA